MFVLIYFLSTSIKSSWQYSTLTNVDYDATWERVKELILENFAGCVIDGVQSPSVQHTIYLAQSDVLRNIKEVDIFFSNYIVLYCNSPYFHSIRSKPSTLKCPTSTILPLILPSFRNSLKTQPTSKYSNRWINRMASSLHS